MVLAHRKIGNKTVVILLKKNTVPLALVARSVNSFKNYYMKKKQKDIIDYLNSLEKQAVAFRRRSFTYNTFVSEFGTDFSVETPIGTVFIDYEQFEKIKTKGRDRYFGLIKPTLEKPVLIIEHNGNQLFVKSFIDKKRGIIYFFSVTKNKDGEILVVSNHEKTKSGLKNKLKEGDVRYISSLEGLGSIFPKDKADVRPKEYITISYGIPLTFANIKKKNNKSQIKMEKKLENTVVNADNEKQASKVSGINKKTKKPEKTKVSEKSKDKKDETKTTKPKYKVEDVATEIRFIKRYTLLHGKVKTKKQILTLLASLQNAILKKQIRKTSPFAKEIDHIQDELISLLSFYGKSEDSVIEIEIDKKSLEKYKSIANSEKVMTAVRLIARYNRLAGKQNVKRKADTLLKSIKNALDKGKIDNYKENIKQIHDSLENYVCGKTEVPEIDEATLNGLKDLIKKKSTKLNNPIHRNKTSAVINSTEFAKLKFTPLLFTGKWAKLIGNPAKPFVMMSYSLPGQGKTSLNIQFAAYLAKEQNKKVLYISDEEKKGYTLQEKIKRFNAVDKNLFLSDRLIDNYKDYDFVIFDSVNSLKLSPEDLKDINSNNPETSFIYVFQTTKDGKFRGSQEFEHDVDVSIELHGGKATTKKTRFGGNGTIKVY